MTIYYLMIKTHNITGLRYLCQTSKVDPYAYLGSGNYWRRHLKLHGNDISTKILRECTSKDEVKMWGMFFSEEFSVVDSSDWANLKIEDGAGGKLTQRSINQAVATRKARGLMNVNSTSSIAKRIETRKLNNTMNTWTDESKAKMVATRLANKENPLYVPRKVNRARPPKNIDCSEK